jgi:hypothetical protein
VYFKSNRMQKGEVYGQLLKVTDIWALEKSAFTVAGGINKFLRWMISQMKNQPNDYRELRKGGFTDAQIPGWVARPAQSVGQLPGPALKPAETLSIVQLGQGTATERPT